MLAFQGGAWVFFENPLVPSAVTCMPQDLNKHLSHSCLLSGSRGAAAGRLPLDGVCYWAGAGRRLPFPQPGDVPARRPEMGKGALATTPRSPRKRAHCPLRQDTGNHCGCCHPCKEVTLAPRDVHCCELASKWNQLNV